MHEHLLYHFDKTLDSKRAPTSCTRDRKHETAVRWCASDLLHTVRRLQLKKSKQIEVKKTVICLDKFWVNAP